MAEDDLEQDLEAVADAAEPVETSGAGKKLLLFVLMPLLVLGGIAAGLHFTGTLDKILRKGPDCAAILLAIESGEAGEDMGNIPPECLVADEDGVTALPPGLFFSVPNIIVNFSGEGGRPSFLKLSVQIEVGSNAEKAKLEEALPRIVDHFQTYLRELRLEDMQGSAGLYRMRIELKSRVSSAVPGVEVRDILFQEILIQQ
ncbi:MAG: flagellar basal body protein FliL [Micavibrio sp.]|nr:MAG: flagellar basal body protein FliL [Micavibrio sp.]